MKNTPFSKEQLYKQYWILGLSLKEIAKENNVSIQTVFRHMKKRNIPRRDYSEAAKLFIKKNPLPSHEKKRLKKLGQKQKIIIPKNSLKQLYLSEKKSTTQIAKMFNCSVPTVSARLKEANIQIRTTSERKSGTLNPSFGKRGKYSYRWDKKHSKETKEKISHKVPRGTKHFRWKPPEKRIEPINNQIRSCYKMKKWKLEIFKRDKFTCVFCGKKRNSKIQINADHIKSFADIKKEYKITSLNEALRCEAFWDPDNGRTLCVSCHKNTKTWGNKKVRDPYNFEKKAEI